MVQTEVQIEMVSTQALIERISELEFKGKPTETSINLPDSPKKPEK
jgi:hypothetical protein